MGNTDKAPFKRKCTSTEYSLRLETSNVYSSYCASEAVKPKVSVWLICIFLSLINPRSDFLGSGVTYLN